MLLSEQRPSATCCLTPDFRLTHSVSDSVRFQSSSALTRLSARIDTVLEESRRAGEDAKNKYAGLIAGYLPGGVRILFNGAELNTEEAVKEEKEGGYLYKNELWLEDNSIVLANKGGTMYNGWVEKEFSGNNVFRRKLYALKAG